MPRLEHKVPQIAKSAFLLAHQSFQVQVNELAKQTVASLGLSEAENWQVDFTTGVISRDVPDIAPSAKVDVA